MQNEHNIAKQRMKMLRKQSAIANRNELNNE